MEKLDEILRRYGIVKKNKISNEQIEYRIKNIYKGFRKTGMKEVNVLYNEMLNTYLNSYKSINSGPVIKNVAAFEKQLKSEGKKLGIESWKLEMLTLENESYLNQPELKFFIDQSKVRVMVVKRISDFREEMEREEPEFCLEYLFNKEEALKKIETKIRKQLNAFRKRMQNAKIIHTMQEELLTELAKIAQSTKEEVIK